MNTLKPLNYKDIDFSKIIYPKEKSGINKKIVYFNYNDDNKIKKFVIQTPTLLSNQKPVKNNSFWELEIPLIGKNDEKLNIFINFLNNLDNKIIEDLYTNSSWFENINNENILYERIIDKDNEECENGVIRLRIINNQSFNTIFQHNKHNINIEDIDSKLWVKMLLEIYGLIISDSGIFLYIRPIILSFKDIVRSDYNYKFLSDSESEEDEILESKELFIKNDSLPEVNTSNYLDSTTSE